MLVHCNPKGTLDNWIFGATVCAGDERRLVLALFAAECVDCGLAGGKISVTDCDNVLRRVVRSLLS